MGMLGFFRWVEPTTGSKHHDNNEDRRDQVTRTLDAHGFDFQVWAVAGSGFLTDSYNLFATNVILPSLAFVYWSSDTVSDGQSSHETYINAITLVGSLLGQLIFGYLADRYGRRKLYGLELIVVIFGTLGMVQCSAGYNNNTMDILGWIMFWRFFVGLGIGAEYPLSAVITAEFAPRKSRARMMAAVFLMQPMGQLLASAMGLIILITVGKNSGLQTETDTTKQREIVDRIWRFVIGVGAIPAFIAIGARLTIPESPRYTLDVDQDGARALKDAQKYYNIAYSHHEPTSEHLLNGHEAQHNNIELADHHHLTNFHTQPKIATARDVHEIEEDSDDELVVQTGANPLAHTPIDDDTEDSPLESEEFKPFSRAELKEYFITQGNIKYLIGTSATWFILDFAFYGLGINNPHIISKIWASGPVPEITNSTINISIPNIHQLTNSTLPNWANPSEPTLGIYDVLYQGGVRSIITISIGSLLGSLILIKAINYFPRRAWLIYSFIALGVLFAVCGGSYFTVIQTDLHALTITLYVLCQLLFNLGPNTLTFIIPAEVFPTRYRATCHGISAAAGKLGSVIVQGMLSAPLLSSSRSPTSNPLGWILIAFSTLMLLGALVAWAWIPEVQNARGSEEIGEGDVESGEGRMVGKKERCRERQKQFEVPSKSLEELAKGRAPDGGVKQGMGFRYEMRSRFVRDKGRKKSEVTGSET